MKKRMDPLKRRMKEIEWDVMKVEGSTDGYKWLYEDNVLMYFNVHHIYIEKDYDDKDGY